MHYNNIPIDWNAVHGIIDQANTIMLTTHENPDGDIRIEYTGLRPGEKLFEELLIGNDVIQSEHPRIMQAIEKKLDINTVLSCIKTIKEAREQQDEKIVKNLLLKYVDGYTSEIL